MPSLLLNFLFENYVLVLLCFVTTPVESLLYHALLRVPQVPQGANPGTQHLLSCTPGTPGSQEQSHRLIQIPISPLPPPGTLGTPGTPDESHRQLQIYISNLPPQVPQVPQGPQINPIAQYKSLYTISLPQVPQVPQRNPIAQYKSLSPIGTA